MATTKAAATGPRKRISSEDRRDQIINIAAQLFSQKGFNGTTTKEIAEHAGVSEAIIFRHFQNKQELYSAILDVKVSYCLNQLWSSSEEFMRKKDDRAVFQAIAYEILETHRQDPTLLRLLYYSALEGHELSNIFFETAARRARDRVAGYLKQRIQDGVCRKINPVVAARSFFALVMHRAAIRELFRDIQWQKTSSREAAAEITDLFLNGVLEKGR